MNPYKSPIHPVVENHRQAKQKDENERLGSVVGRVFVGMYGYFQIFVASAFIVFGEFGKPAVFAMAWLVPAIPLFIISFSEFEPRWIRFTVICNVLGIIFLLLAVKLFPAWIFGNVMVAYHAHILFTGCAVFLNIPPVVFSILWRRYAIQSFLSD